MDRRWRRPSVARWGAAAGLVLVLVMVVGVVLDTLWLRPLVQGYVQRHAGRRIEFDQMHLRLDHDLRPTIRFRNLSIENARWASVTAPLIHAGEFDMSFTWASLWRQPMVMTRMRLVDADVDLEMQADGLRNWRLGRPDDRGPGTIRVRSLDALRSRVRFLHRGIDLDVALATGALDDASNGTSNGASNGTSTGTSTSATGKADAPKAAPSSPSAVAASQSVAAREDAAPPPTRSLTLHGRRHGVDFDARAAISEVLTFYDTGEPFRLQGELHTPGARLTLDGSATDLVQMTKLAAGFDVGGARLGELGAVFGHGILALPDYPAQVAGHVLKAAARWHIDDLSAHLGRSDLAGSLSYEPRQAPGRPASLQATLVGQRLDWAQLRPASRSAVRSPEAREVAAERPGWADMDVDVDLRLGGIDGLPLHVGGVHAGLVARNGIWRMAPVALTAAGGQLHGVASADSSVAPVAVAVDLQLDGLPLAQFGAKGLTGRLEGRATLHARGDHVAALIESAEGSLVASLRDASVPAALEAKLGLDGGEWLRSLVGAASRSAVLCSTLTMRLEGGVARIGNLAVETGNVLVDGTGSLDLARRTLDLTLTPYRKHASLLALDRSVRVTGPAHGMRIALVDAAPGARRHSCLDAPAVR